MIVKRFSSANQRFGQMSHHFGQMSSPLREGLGLTNRRIGYGWREYITPCIKFDMTSPPLPTPVPPPLSVTVGALARTLHAAESGELEIEVPTGAPLDLSGVTGASVQDGKLRFECLEDRNAAAAADVLTELGVTSFDHEVVWAAARELWRCEIGNADMASGRLLASVHPRINVLRLAAARITSQSDVFDALHLVEATLPYLEAFDPSDIVSLCDAEHPLTQHDFAGGNLYGALTYWFRPRPTAAREMVELLLAEPRQTCGNLLGAAWIAWFAAEPQASVHRLLNADTRSDLAALHEVTCWIAGKMLADPALPTDLGPPLEARILARISDEAVMPRQAGLRAASTLLHIRRSFDAALRACIAGGDHEAAGWVMQGLTRNQVAMLQAGTFFDWLHLCIGLDEGFERVLDGLDHSLSVMLRPGSLYVKPVIAFLEAWVLARSAAKTNREFAQRFDACTSAVLSQPELLATVFTRWMFSDGQALAIAAASIAMTARTGGQSVIAFDPLLLHVASEADLRFLVKRMLGFLIEADQMLSLALSLLQLRDAKARMLPLLRWLLLEEIGYDYPGTTSKVLRARAAQEEDIEIKDLLVDIATRLDDDLAALEALPRLRELTVPRSLRRDFAKARDKAMEHSVREAQERSVLAQLVSKVHIKAGETTFQYLGESFSEPMGFASHSVSFELPRREVLDPVGNTYRRLRLRATRRDQT